MTQDPTRFQAAIERLDAAHREDPQTMAFQGKEYPRELLYAERMTHWLEALAPDASEPLRLAARAQHLRRWEIPRENYPANRHGYHLWRSRLYDFQADKAAEILGQVGYDGATIERVGDLVRKKRLKSDPQTQLLEDAAGIVFLENYFAGFVREHEEETMIRVIRRTWRKMSPRGHRAALGLEMAADDRALIDKALERAGEDP